MCSCLHARRRMLPVGPGARAVLGNGTLRSQGVWKGRGLSRELWLCFRALRTQILHDRFGVQRLLCSGSVLLGLRSLFFARTVIMKTCVPVAGLLHLQPSRVVLA